MEALYKRVLAHVPTPQLHESYNAVLHEEYASVSQSLGDVLAAFAKLQEVRDAVSKLQQQSHEASAGGCSSDSVRASADELVELQRQLQRQAERLALGMEVAMVERKRKRVEEAAVAKMKAPRAAGDERWRTSYNAAAKRVKRLEADAESSSDRYGEEEERKRNALEAAKKEGGGSTVLKRAAAAAPSSKASSSSESEGGEEKDGSKEDDEDVEGSEAAWRALMNSASSSEVKTDPCHALEAEKPEADTSTTTKSVKDMATHMTTIVSMANQLGNLNRSFVMPELLTMLKESVEEDVGRTQQSEVTNSLKILVGWNTRDWEYHAQHAALYREYASVVESYVERLPSSKQKAELKRLKEALLSMIESLDGLLIPDSKMAVRAAAIQENKRTQPFSRLIGRPDTMVGIKRTKRLFYFLLAFKKETADDVDDSFGKRMIKVVEKLARWLSEDLQEPLNLLLYRMIVNTLREFSERLPGEASRVRLVELLRNMSEGISDSPTARNRLVEIRNRATQVFEKVKHPILKFSDK
ncbi:uncharacterized protein IUM83_10098 [Phytophthora cinnamomi]|uniref:uncharacterized protein n=1 Tax=Phytophthora cinnamomi TaxID=4785 RepID=UPI0035597B87|nr:hypothetical protein IUM83_10098 [Phytophthora cinnamomi]